MKKKHKWIKISEELIQAERDSEKAIREITAATLPLIQKQTEELILGKPKRKKLTHASELAPGSKYASPIITHSQPAIVKLERKPARKGRK